MTGSKGDIEMATNKSVPKKAQVINPVKSSLIARSLTVLDLNVARIEERLQSARPLDPRDSAVCVIDVDCCIINCKTDRNPGDQVINPGDILEVNGFVFKLPAQAGNADAPVYFLSKLGAKTAWKLSHESVKVPGRNLEGRVLGVAAEIFTRQALSKHGIAPTAPVIALVPKKVA
jgi:hypothetical protein